MLRLGWRWGNLGDRGNRGDDFLLFFLVGVEFQAFGIAAAEGFGDLQAGLLLGVANAAGAGCYAVGDPGDGYDLAEAVEGGG